MRAKKVWSRFRGLDAAAQLGIAGGLAAFLVVGVVSGASSKTQTVRTTSASKVVVTTAPSPTTAAKPTSTTAASVASPTPTSSLPPESVPLAAPSESTAPATSNGIDAEPRADLTPGATDPAVSQTNIDSTICLSGYTQKVRPSTSYTDKVKTDRLAAYGYTQGKASFELDHLVPLELGGAPSSVANLWPEPWEKSGLVPDGWGAETKDQFENYLHRAVCAHRVLLVDAQQQMAQHWIVAAQSAGIAAGNQATPAIPTTSLAQAPPTTSPATTTAPTPAGGDTYYANCDAARAAHAAPLHRGDPGYRPQLDRDGDGIACE